MERRRVPRIFGRKPVTEARAGDRTAVTIPATARLPVGDKVPIEIEDLSASGFRARISVSVRPSALLRIGLPTGRSPHARVVWAREGVMGCAFVGALDPTELAALIED